LYGSPTCQLDDFTVLTVALASVTRYSIAIFKFLNLNGKRMIILPKVTSLPLSIKDAIAATICSS